MQSHLNQHNQLQFAYSIDSVNNSVNSTSFLTAANTIVFKNSSNAGSSAGACNNSVNSNSSFVKLYSQPGLNNSPIFGGGGSSNPRSNSLHNGKAQKNNSPLLSNFLEKNSFSNTLLEIQQNQVKMDDLDFDLNYNSNKTALEEPKKKKSSSIGQPLFRDDENLFDEDDISIDSEFPCDDNNTEQFMNDMSEDGSNQVKQQQPTTVRFLLENRLRMTNFQTKTMPIDQSGSGIKTDLNNNNNSNINKLGTYETINSAKNNNIGNILQTNAESQQHEKMSKFANQDSVNSSLHSPPNLSG